jgi:hypothetical protein
MSTFTYIVVKLKCRYACVTGRHKNVHIHIVVKMKYRLAGSAGQPGGAQVSTTAEVLVVPPDSAAIPSKEEIQRKLSQLSDEDVQVPIL